ncbi:MAG: tRNA (guanosine(46)-N7)-methyltransferase TrmB [Alphaproteobacteria bacterium]|nr:tRNA (guanosine(46)-N7)-methyltransferase TrmB [Alphaproteobacteria bacterium]
MSDQRRPPRDHDFHGRRHGRRLRPKRQALLDRELPRLAITLPPRPYLDPATLFGASCRHFEIEIGFGAGEHLVARAEALPAVGFIGCEAYINGVARLIDHISERGVTNIRIWPDDARRLLPMLATASFARACILFPDPWPKARHAKRRLISAETLDALARILADDGELRLASDDMAYIRAILLHLRRHPEFTWSASGPADWRHRPDGWLETRYERKAIEQGRRTIYLTARREPRQPVR